VHVDDHGRVRGAERDAGQPRVEPVLQRAAGVPTFAGPQQAFAPWQRVTRPQWRHRPPNTKLEIPQS